MEYKIISVSHQEDTITTTVEFQLISDKLTVNIPHYKPTSIEQIIDNIINRGLSEQAKLDSINACTSLLSSIPVNETISF
jgi:hypothetical protein